MLIQNTAVPGPSSPAAEYLRRLASYRDELVRTTRLAALLSWSRLAVFFTAVVIGIAAARGLVTPYWLLAPAGAFLALAVRHARVLGRIQVIERGTAFYQRGLARINDRWAGEGDAGDRFVDENHLYARDLDLFGSGSLFQLLSIARTGAGAHTLARWLLQGAPRDEILLRQVAVTELTLALDLREAVAGAGQDVRQRVDPHALVEWAEGPVTLGPPPARSVVLATTLATIAVVALVLRGDLPGVAILVALAMQGVASLPWRYKAERLLHGADAPARELLLLTSVLSLLERQAFVAPRLQSIHHRLVEAGASATSSIGRLKTLIEMHDWQHNILFAPVAAVLLWDVHLAWAVQAWRLAHGRHVRSWLDAAGEFEALSSLACYRYEHPDDPYPQIDEVPAAAPPRPHVEGASLGHPLIPADRMVRNDISLTGDTRLYVISGSNMSGKSTFLRTVGINVVLAHAGAPVRAASMRLTPLTLGATLRIQDSLQEGHSRFYAEITRIRDVSDIARRGEPLLFLLDELLHGTNSHDRLTGASGILRGLVDRGAVGLITTHDLALTAIADALSPRAINVHFDDWFEGSELRFDYRMKPGPVTRSNAVALMRAVGLDVPLQ